MRATTVHATTVHTRARASSPSPRACRQSCRQSCRQCSGDGRSGKELLIKYLQQMQIKINGRAVLRLMEQVQARGAVVVKNKPVELLYPHVMVNIEAKTEKACGGYVLEARRTVADMRSMAVLSREQLPSFTQAYAYARSESGEDLQIGTQGDHRLQLTPLHHTVDASRVRAQHSGVPVLIPAPNISGITTLLAQGEVETPIPLDQLKSFCIEVTTVHSERVRTGPFSSRSIMRQFNDDCTQRKRFFASHLDSMRMPVDPEQNVLFTAPMQVNVKDDTGSPLVCRLVRHRDKVCLLGIAVPVTVNVKSAPPIPECAMCLDECDSCEWSCVQCRNLLHHKCREKLLAIGMEACPYCRHVS